LLEFSVMLGVAIAFGMMGLRGAIGALLLTAQRKPVQLPFAKIIPLAVASASIEAFLLATRRLVERYEVLFYIGFAMPCLWFVLALGAALLVPSPAMGDMPAARLSTSRIAIGMAIFALAIAGSIGFGLTIAARVRTEPGGPARSRRRSAMAISTK